MLQIESVLSDKGSKYAVSGGRVNSHDDVKAFLKKLQTKKKYAKATHNTWAVIFQSGVNVNDQAEPHSKNRLKNDDGESGAGMIILRMLEREALYNHIVVVTRWYGGVHLGGDRFRHVQTCVNRYLNDAKLNAT